MTGTLTNITAYILCQIFISFTDFEGQLMDLILHEELSTNSGHYIFLVKVGDMYSLVVCKQCGIEFNNFCNSNTVLSYCTKDAHDGNI